MKPMDQTAMRRVNTAAALSTLYHSGPATISQLTTLSGLSRRTLNLILGPLIHEGWVLGSPPDDSDLRPVGRPARTLSFNFNAAYVVAIQLDVDYIGVLVADLEGKPRGEHHVFTPVEGKSLSRSERLAKVYSCTESALDRAGVQLRSIIAVTMSTPGIVRDDGKVDLPWSIRQWSGFSLSEELQRFFPCPVYVENDAKLAAIGERWRGTDRVTQNFVWMRADGVRMGIGVVLNGQLYRGHDGAAGEIVWTENLGFGAVRSHILSGLADPDHPNHNAAIETVERARAGNKRALDSIRQLARLLAPGIGTIAWVLAPEEIIIGGSLGGIADLLIPALDEVFTTTNQRIESRIVGSQVGERAMIFGALKTCLDIVERLLFSGERLPRVPGTTKRQRGNSVRKTTNKRDTSKIRDN